MKTYFKKMFLGCLIVMLSAAPVSLTAQPGGGCSPCCGDPGCTDPCPPSCVPIDGGLSLLIAAGIGLGAKKAYDRKKAAVKNAE